MSESTVAASPVAYAPPLQHASNASVVNQKGTRWVLLQVLLTKRIVTRIDWLVSCVSLLGRSIVPVRIFYTSASPLRASICDPVVLLLRLHTWKYLVQECQLWKVAFQKLFLPDQWQDCGCRSLVFTHTLDRLPTVFGGRCYVVCNILSCSINFLSIYHFAIQPESGRHCFACAAARAYMSETLWVKLCKRSVLRPGHGGEENSIPCRTLN